MWVDFDLRNKFGRSHILLYAKNKKGLEALFNLSTKAFLNSDRDGYFIEEKDIFDNAQDFVHFAVEQCRNDKYSCQKRS